jgi:hypothetical protein
VVGGAEQPIPFPHDVHAGTNQIPCMYCHSSADRSVDAGIPAMEVCAGCHIPGGVPMVAADSAGVRLLTAYWNEGRADPVGPDPRPARPRPVPPHDPRERETWSARSAMAQVEAMEVIEQGVLRMGWCLECHREREVRTDCTVCHY